ncbi:MAG: D-glucuronyl C5-epimerase family protein [Candidatus Aquilonibacter sp.]
MLSQVRSILLVPWPIDRPHRLFDERAGELGPYYVTFGQDGEPCELDPERILRRNGERHPIAILQFGLEQHARWKRTGDEAARELFLVQAEWAAGAQRETAGVRGSYQFPFASKRYGCATGFRSAMAQGEAISLLLRAYQETGHAMFLDRAVDASVPLTVDVRDGGVLWRTGDDLFFEGVAGTVPSHILCGWICALWGLLELSRTTDLDRIAELYRQSLATLEKYLPCYDSGTWSYDNLLATPTGFRRFATLQRHLLHVAQLNVLLSMTKNELFSVVAERWRRYSASLEGRLSAWVSGLPSLLLLDLLTVPGGARSVV